jgi:transcriptional regulator with XRE-family HTH domain
MLKIYTAAEVRELRRKSGLNQNEFWKRLGVKQSVASRYELGRKMPAPVQLLLNVAFGTEAKSAAYVDSLRALAKPSRETVQLAQKPPKAPAKFGFLP